MKKKHNLKGSLKTFFKILKYLKKYKLLFFISLGLTLASVALTLYVPILVGDAIDLAVDVDNVDIEGISKILFKIAVSVVLTAIMQWLINVINNRMTFGIAKNIRYEAFTKIQKFPISYIDSHSTGEIVSKLITDVEQFSDGILLGLTQFFNGIATIIGTLIFMLTINPIISLIVVFVTPLSLFVAAFIAKKTYSMFKLQSEIRSEQTSLIDEMISGKKIVRAFSQEENVQASFDAVNNKLETASLKAIFFSSITNPSTRFVNSLVYTFVAFGGAMLYLSGNFGLTIGMLSSFLAYSTQYTKPFNEISGVVTELQNSFACAERVFDIISAPVLTECSDENDSFTVDGNVSFEKVSFSYTKDRPLICDFDLKVSSGQHIAIVGPTGCGKTTLINLLMRFYDVNEGQIKLDNTDITRITRKKLRSSYGMVLQDTWLIPGTIRENIAFARPDASDEDVIAAAKAAHAHSFIRKLPQGYNTHIGENGGALSQGQKQLLCIARVMLDLPEMLILDEATSSIDTRTELKIQNAFSTMMNGRTSFIVAHRLSTIKEADIILVMNNGNVIEKGNHSELLAKKGFYHKLYHSQFSNT